MSTATQTPAKTQPANPARQFRTTASSIAKSLLTEWVGDDRAKEATGRISAALAASAASARNPQDFYDCTSESIGRCIAIAALTEIMPGVGSTSLAYLIPRRARKGEQPQLNYQLSHRGLNALARRTGQTMIAIPIGMLDELAIDQDGDVRVVDRDIDRPPTSDQDLRGVIVLVRELSTGKTVCRGWVPVSIINQRRATSDSYQFAQRTEWAQKTDPWHVWYVEMAMKTAMHYAISRGWCVIDDASATKALAVEQTQDLSIARPKAIDADKSKSERLADDLEARMLGGQDDVSGVGPTEDEPAVESDDDAPQDATDGPPADLPPSEKFGELVTLIESKRAASGYMQARQEVLNAKDYLSQDEYDGLLQMIKDREEQL